MQPEHLSQDAPAASDAAPAIPRRSGQALTAAIVLLAGLFFVWIGLRGRGAEPAPLPSSDSRPARIAGEESPPSDAAAKSQEPATGKTPVGTSASGSTGSGASGDDVLRRRIVGDWTRDYSGTWVMTIRDDGTGIMTVTPDRVWSLIVGSKITIEMTWEIAGGRVIFDSVRGEPESSFAIVMKLWKSHQDRELIEISDDNLIYRSDDGKSQSKWTRSRKNTE